MTLESIKKIMFHYVMVFSVYNPSFLFEKLETLGYEISHGSEGYVAKKKVGDKHIEMGGLHHYCRMIQGYMFTEAGVFDFLSSIGDLALCKDYKFPTKMNIYCEQKI